MSVLLLLNTFTFTSSGTLHTYWTIKNKGRMLSQKRKDMGSFFLFARRTNGEADVFVHALKAGKFMGRDGETSISHQSAARELPVNTIDSPVTSL